MPIPVLITSPVSRLRLRPTFREGNWASTAWRTFSSWLEYPACRASRSGRRLGRSARVACRIASRQRLRRGQRRQIKRYIRLQAQQKVEIVPGLVHTLRHLAYFGIGIEQGGQVGAGHIQGQIAGFERLVGTGIALRDRASAPRAARTACEPAVRCARRACGPAARSATPATEYPDPPVGRRPAPR